MGDHSESVEIDFDPNRISYDALLSVFWRSHNPTYKSSRQYMSAILVRNEAQMQAALTAKEQYEERREQKVFTEIRFFERFYWAEDYHQKYSLRRVSELSLVYSDLYPRLEDFVNSTATARVNGFASGYGNVELLEQEIESYGLSEAAKGALRSLAWRFEKYR